MDLKDFIEKIANVCDKIRVEFIREKGAASNMRTYNKLVRDKIPEIIEGNGEKPVTRILNDEEYLKELNTKLQEEVSEYFADGNVEELADIVEVVYGLLDAKGVSLEEFEKIRIGKVKKRGAFKERIYLESVE